MMEPIKVRSSRARPSHDDTSHNMIHDDIQQLEGIIR